MLPEKTRCPVIYLGLSLDYYRVNSPDRVRGYGAVFATWRAKLAERFDIKASSLCWSRDEVSALLRDPKAAGARAIVVSPLSYTASAASAPELAAADLPTVFWNTQSLEEITEDFRDIDLSYNHTVQGTQDVGAVLFRAGVPFGCVTGHWSDAAALDELELAVRCAAAAHAARTVRILAIGGRFEGMDDFLYDPEQVRQTWGPVAVPRGIDELLAARQAVGAAALEEAYQLDRAKFDVSGIDPAVHRESVAWALALEALYRDAAASGLTLNFKAVREDGRAAAMPFYGINRLIAQGAGYAGEGDFLRAALMAELAQVGSVNFTEIYPADFVNDRLLMSHMQECNPAWADPRRGVRLEAKSFSGAHPMTYAAMRFVCGEAPVTLVNLTQRHDGGFRLIAGAGRIADGPWLEGYTKPYWYFTPEKGRVARWLSNYTLSGGTHHLIALKAPLRAVAELARHHDFDFVTIQGE